MVPSIVEQWKDIAAIELQVSHPLDKHPEISYANQKCTTCVYSCFGPLFSGAFTCLKNLKLTYSLSHFSLTKLGSIVCLPLAIQSIPLVALIVVCED